MIRHAQADAPLECCGLLVGRGDTIEECVPTVNVRHSESAYQVDPAVHFATLRRVRETDHRIVGAYHSHPRSAALPSATDVAEAYDPDLIYVIVSLADSGGPAVRAYSIRDGACAEITLSLV
jgi:proteasome lid subunit RPN8/RPN11